MTQPSVCVVGSVNLDLVAAGSRLPTPGETIIDAVFSRYPGGKGANQALAARRLGADVTLIAAVGADTHATEALKLLRKEGVDLSQVIVMEDQHTGVALIVVDANGENQIAVASGANMALKPEHLDVGGFDVVLCQLEVSDDVALEAGRQATGLFVVNTAPARLLPDGLMKRADVIVANEIEHEILEPQLSRFGGLLIVTRGARGADATRRGRSEAYATPPAIDAVDTVGAGDAFCGGLADALARGLPTDVALDRACLVGAVTATRRGAQPSLPTVSELNDFNDAHAAS